MSKQATTYNMYAELATPLSALKLTDLQVKNILDLTGFYSKFPF